jgi:dienelactone hydrolase
MVPGFISPIAMMASWGTFLASRGFAAILVDPPTALDLPPTRSRAQITALQSLVAEATRAGSPLNGKLDVQKLAAGGWSMGGGGTMETANTSPPLPGLKAAFPLAPWNIGGIYSRTQVPSIVFAGTADILVPPSMARPEYDSIPAGTPKAYVEFQGADHFIFTSPNGGGGQLGSYTHAWLQVHLNGRAECKAALVRGSGMSNFLSASL